MPLSHLEILVEEASMEAFLRSLLPKIVGSVNSNFQVFRGKQALLRELPRRMRGLRQMLQPGWLILVVVDCDRDDCRQLKSSLEAASRGAGLTTRSSKGAGRFSVLNRIAIEELEAWYLGDWPAVKTAYPRVPSSVPDRAGYRIPDAVAGGTWEAFERILVAAGYFPGGLPKIEVAQCIAPHMDPARNTSRSFQVFRDALLEAAHP
ncbi:MAG TPA: DUF4276 family protein [Acetobacteraceae bacterium]|jgi:hypothetical protein